jgi:protocatechuate 3,4-dioxygenase beta subunit
LNASGSGETFTNVEGKYQIVNLEPGTYTLSIAPSAGYENVFSKGGINLSNRPIGSGSLQGGDKDTITAIKGYAEDLISDLDFGLDNKDFTNVYTKIALAGYTDAVAIDVEYGNTTNILAQGVQLQIKLDSNVLYSGASNANVKYDATGHQLLLSLGDLSTKNNHFTLFVTIDPTKLTEDTIRYHSFNFVSSIQTTTLPEITNLDNVDSIDQRIVMVGDIYGKVYNDSDRVLGRNPVKDKGLSGYLVELRTTTGMVVKTAFTNAAGQYQFLNVKPDTYHLSAPAIGDYHNFGSFLGVLSGTATMTGRVIDTSTLEIPVVADMVYADNDFSVITLTSSLSGTVTLDTGVPLQGIEVQLWDTAAIVAKVYTDSGGNYTFTKVDKGTYSIKYVLPSMYLAQQAFVGSL